MLFWNTVKKFKLFLLFKNQIRSFARFIRHRNQYNADLKRPTFRAFLPAPTLELSVFDIDKLNKKKILEIGDKNIRAHFYGFAILHADVISDQNLTVSKDNNPKGHANIVGWPVDKSDTKLIAMELAKRSELILK